MDGEMRRVLAELELLSNGRVASFDGRVTGSKDRSPLMRLSELPLHEHYARRWHEAETAGERATVLAEAQATLRSMRFSPPPPRDSVPWQERVGRSTLPPAELAAEYGITRQYAWQLQQRYGGGPSGKSGKKSPH